MITVTVSGRRATAANLIALPTGNVQSIKVQFIFQQDDSLWKNALIVAVFAAKTPKGGWIVCASALDENLQSAIPGAVLGVAESEVYVGVRATYADNREVTTNIVCLGKTCMGAGGEIVDSSIANSMLSQTTKFFSAIYTLVSGKTHSHMNQSVLDSITSDAVSNSHAHINSAVLDRFTGTGDAVDYNGKTVVLADKDNFTPLELNTEYARLVFRTNIEEVPVLFHEVGLYEMPEIWSIGEGQYSDMHIALLNEDGYGVHVYHKFAASGGNGLSGIVIVTDSEVTFDGNVGVYGTDSYGESGWQVGEGVAHITGNELKNFTPNFYRINETDVYDIEGSTNEQLFAIRYINQILNVSQSAMGLVHECEDKVLRYMNSRGLKPNKKYFLDLQEDLYEAGHQDPMFWLPDETDMIDADDDAQIVIYLNTDFDADITFDYVRSFEAYIKFVDGKYPDTSTGLHKIILTWIPMKKTWLIGSIDYAEVT